MNKITGLVQTVYFDNFRRAFKEADRENNFSYEGLRYLYDYLEQLAEDLGEPIEFDVIAICCDYSEVAPEDLKEAYGIELGRNDDLQELLQAKLDGFIAILNNGNILIQVC